MKLQSLPNLSVKRAGALQKAGIHSVEDLLLLFPRRYLDKTTVTPISHLSGTGETVTVIGKVVTVTDAGFGRKKRLEVVIRDESAALKGVWFRGASYFKKIFQEGQTVAFYGSVKKFGHSLSMAHPEVEPLESDDDSAKLKRVVPIYPGGQDFSKSYITNKLISSWMMAVLKQTEPAEFIPEHLLKTHGFPQRAEAFRQIHFPQFRGEHQKALERFKFEELFLFELSMAKTKFQHFEQNSGYKFDSAGEFTKRFFNEILPFELTDGQKSSLREIKNDLSSGRQMHRLIQGDVGAGKTVVAIGALLMAIDNGYQTAFMAPTEILAEQHFRTLDHFLSPLGINIRLLTGGQKKKLRDDILSDIAGGSCQIVIGTHAIIQEKVQFHKLGLAVIDEQHRFGVKQRSDILAKGENPHLLVMSATPIPRSLAMSIYSDLDISILKGLPGGRLPVKTAIRTENKRADVYSFIQDNLNEGGQAYFIYPLVEESELIDLKDATMGFEKLKKHFPDYRVDLVHGKMKSDEKDTVMKNFISGNTDILVSTTVIEVGVDVPNANIMVIEHAERFGLSQLHQLRGRIGRGSRQSYCILIPGDKVSNDGRTRLNKMAETNDGFEIAETDLKLRGPGDFLGTKQSGLPEFRFADIVEDQWILQQAKDAAWEIMKKDPELDSEENRKLKSVFNPYYREKMQFYGLG